MDVYAEYFEGKKLTFRRNTILQFGNSWQLIGNIVLANPGSAKPLNRLTPKCCERLKYFYNKFRSEEEFNSDHWYKFSSDPTMRFIEKIFTREYLGKSKKLNGVIQLFNTFNIKNQNLEEAIEYFECDSDLMYSLGIEKYFHDKPTYFGFGKKVLNNRKLRNIAKEIFNNSSQEILNFYEKKFSDNEFYHPIHINTSHKKDDFQWYKDRILKPLIENL